MSRVEERLRELGVELPEPPPSVANYVNAVRTGNLVYVAGHAPRQDGRYVCYGKVGADLDVQAAYRAARLCAIDCLASVKAEIGDLDRVTRIVKVLGLINATPDFKHHPQVIDGASDLLVEVFGERGRHARSAVGMSGMPMDISMEVEMVVEIA